MSPKSRILRWGSSASPDGGPSSPPVGALGPTPFVAGPSSLRGPLSRPQEGRASSPLLPGNVVSGGGGSPDVPRSDLVRDCPARKAPALKTPKSKTIPKRIHEQVEGLLRTSSSAIPRARYDRPAVRPRFHEDSSFWLSGSSLSSVELSKPRRCRTIDEREATPSSRSVLFAGACGVFAFFRRFRRGWGRIVDAQCTLSA